MMTADHEPAAAPRSPYVPVAGRDAVVWQLWDQNLGYVALHDLACARRPRQARDRHDDLLRRRFAVVPVVAPDEADRIKDLVFTADGANRCDQLSLAEMGDLFDRLFAGPLDDALAAILQADYIPIFVGANVARASAAGGDDVSFRWHCDGGPHNHLKVLLYLDEADSHDGATLVIDRATTDRFKATGYVFDQLDTRVADLAPLAESFGIDPCAQVVCRPGKGEAVLFEPVNVLHRGRVPSFGRRHVLTVGIVPFPFERRAILPRAYAQIRSNTEFNFPSMNDLQ